MSNKRVTSGRLAKVESRRRAKRVRLIVGVIAFSVATVLVIIAIQHRNALFRHGDGNKTTETRPPEEIPSEVSPEETGVTAPTSELKVIVINNTRVPQRFGNALTAIEAYNAENEGIFTVKTERPEIQYGPGTMVLHRPGYKEHATAIAAVLGGEFPIVQADITMVCGQDISELILEAFVKEGRLTEEVRVEVLNGCGLEGAAGKTKERLESNGYTVVAVGNAVNFDNKKTVLYVGEGQENNAKRIGELFGMDESNLKKADYDVKVVVNDDYST